EAFAPLAGGERRVGESRSEGEGVTPEEPYPWIPPHPRLSGLSHPLDGDATLSPPAGRGETRAFSFPPDLSVDDAVEDDEPTS
ncbi:hypothetical protein QR79_18595, partial [Methylobacterium indicum]